MPKASKKTAVQKQVIVVHSVAEVYDVIMGQIEPELTTTQLPILKKKYAKETVKEQKARAARYNKAFKKYHTIAQKFISGFQKHFKASKKKAMKDAEVQNRSVEEQQMKDLESLLSS